MHSCDSQTSLRQNPARVPAFLLPGLPGIVVAFCLVLAGCNDTPHKAETDEPLPVAAVKPERRNVPLLVESTGMTQAVRTADIVARVEGTLQKIAYEDGALVQEGDTLFVIDPTMINGMKTSGKKRDNLGSIGKSFRRGCNSIAESATKKEGNQPSFFVGG